MTPDARSTLAALRAELNSTASWSAPDLEAMARTLAEAKGIKLGLVAQPLRAALSGATTSPPIFEVMQVLGKDETLGRIDDALAA